MDDLVSGAGVSLFEAGEGALHRIQSAIEQH
jgi:hypothetical protein